MNWLSIVLVVAAVIIISSLYHGHIHQNSVTKYDILQEKQNQLHESLHRQLQEMHVKQNDTISKLEKHREDTNKQFKDHHQNTIDFLQQQQETQQDSLTDIGENVSDISTSIDEKVKHIADNIQTLQLESPNQVQAAKENIQQIEVPLSIKTPQHQTDTINYETHPNSYDFLKHQSVEMEDKRMYGSQVKPYGGSCPYPYYFGTHNDYRPFVSKDLEVVEGFSNYEDSDDLGEPQGTQDDTGYGKDDGDFQRVRNTHVKKIQQHSDILKNHLQKANRAHQALSSAIHSFSDNTEASSQRQLKNNRNNQQKLETDKDDRRFSSRRNQRLTQAPDHMKNLLHTQTETNSVSNSVSNLRNSYQQRRVESSPEDLDLASGDI